MNADLQSTERRPFFARSDLLVGLAAYLASSTLVLLAGWFGTLFVSPLSPAAESNDFWSALDRWDGAYYRDIAQTGYRYEPGKQGVVAFFPAYPLLIRAGVFLTGGRVEIVAIVVAHLMLAFGSVLLHAYARGRLPDVRMANLAVLGFAILPTTVFFRFGYSESTFFLLVLLFLIGLERRWPLLALGLIAGAATATRAPGIALLPVLLVETWRRTPRCASFLPRALVLTPLACWGLLAFIAHQWQAFDEPLAFAKIQKNWDVIERSFEDSLLSLATYEPGWGSYDDGSPRYWAKAEFHGRGPFSIFFANPLFFTATLVLVLFGGWRRILNARELWVALGLLAIPYVTKGYTSSMGSFGRFTAVVVPVYLVSGWLLARMPVWVVGLVVAAGTFWLTIYAMMFTAGWEIT